MNKFPDKKIIFNEIQNSIFINSKTIMEKFFSKNFFDIFLKTKKGIYIFGTVGTGKTEIVKKLYNEFDIKKKFFHFQKFSKFIHEKLHIYYSSNPSNSIEILAKEISNDTKILVIDELEVRDITDAMMLKNLFFSLIKKKVFIIFTSNIKPQDLYIEGIQRESFLPFIDMINENFEIFSIISDIDYRSLQIKNSKKIIFENIKDDIENFWDLVKDITDNFNFKARILSVFGRNIVFEKTYKNILLSSQDELFKKKLSYNDYIEICKEFEAVIIPNIKEFDHEDSNEIIRFINFIDNMYSTNTLLIANFETKKENIYKGIKQKKEFKRCISRLEEMNSASFVSSSKIFNH